ncbi:MAG: DUF447 family protein [Planctomycetales bacterium]|nr:DUF447 family protein [Planctomycetales bacterium]NIM08726.1 DUF447 family protein [Planctomycetales bacterium]NIN08196.1 DUF447 family protein [Planctomycetales bacterium]NIN77324.1 DUF447 family protein [Planctomycetales bacterium]NIO34508.1 DUF447 family protein [Planctomycetales bacterium]
MILEGIMTTLDEDGTLNISPMGPIVDPPMQRLLFRPFQTSHTFVNLQRSGEGIFHVTDNVEMLARAAVGQLDPQPPTVPAAAVAGRILSDACRWYAVRVTSVDTSRQRAEIVTRVVDQGRQRDFFGLNRAKHAVVEAAILATRVDLLPAEEIQNDYRRLEVLVEKTGGPAEQRAFKLLAQYVRRSCSAKDAIP